MIARRSFLTTAGLGLLAPAIASSLPQNTQDVLNMEFAFKTEVTLDKPLEVGITQHGNRRIIPITGGSFEGPLLKGTIVPGGADWQIIRSDGVAELEAKYTLRTTDDALIYISNRGYRHGPPAVIQRLAKGEAVDPQEYYFRCTPVFETSSEKYNWLNRYIFIATGERKADRVILNFYKLL